MRVVAGTARGRRLAAPVGPGTRPTADRVRQATFNALDSRGAVAGAVVLHAFAGSGALGVEALSRGAARVVFVEWDGAARRVIRANLATTGLGDGARVGEGDALAHLATTPDRYDLVLLDPPHATATWPALLAAVARCLAPGAVVVAESDRPIVGRDGTIDGTGAPAGPGGVGTGGPGGPDGGAGPGWTVIREKRYGGTVVQMMTIPPAPPSPRP